MRRHIAGKHTAPVRKDNGSPCRRCGVPVSAQSCRNCGQTNDASSESRSTHMRPTKPASAHPGVAWMVLSAAIVIAGGAAALAILGSSGAPTPVTAMQDRSESPTAPSSEIGSTPAPSVPQPVLIECTPEALAPAVRAAVAIPPLSADPNRLTISELHCQDKYAGITVGGMSLTGGILLDRTNGSVLAIGSDDPTLSGAIPSLRQATSALAIAPSTLAALFPAMR